VRVEKISFFTIRSVRGPRGLEIFLHRISNAEFNHSCTVRINKNYKNISKTKEILDTLKFFLSTPLMTLFMNGPICGILNKCASKFFEPQHTWFISENLLFIFLYF